jgi:hypothetical protein
MAGVTAFAGCVVIAKRKENNTKNEKVEDPQEE